ncbi:RNA polymerase II-associated protein 1 [Triplophysa rosa]|uniref:RNA polymerase II-associated protein 1 n=1 Tax=Triplophysa rosa TaxID=992332 RepID=A0A9W7TWY2_TRIRA|nr:RNA polymerase II-associated protein 1 [Triplophysa rosa]KAI7804611.1 putative RNA polymerase II-associated protein 1 [Triplophysa rosa]
MLRRPKPADSEADLLEQQQEFLTAGSRSVTVVKRPDKRRGDVEEQDNQRDVVTIEDLPDQIPTLTPAPPKKSRFKKDRVRFEDEDPDERLDRHDTHISAVLSRIIERDTSAVPVSLPTFTGTAFPKVLHRSVVESEGMEKGPRGRKSIFARQIAARRANKEDAHSLNGSGTEDQSCGATNFASLPLESMDTELSTSNVIDAVNAPLLVSGQGLGIANSGIETIKIHQENQAKLQAMSQSEILEEQRMLLAQLDPRLVDFVRSQKAQITKSSESASGPGQQEVSLNKSLSNSTASALDYTTQAQETPQAAIEDDQNEENENLPVVQHPITEDELPIKPQKEWIHMDKLEPEKLEWTRDPPPKKQSTKKAMQARFNFAGTLIPPTEDLPTHLGLHHHGEEPELAGYSLQELFILSRSQLNQQRNLAVSTLANVLTNARAGEYTSSLKSSVLSCLLDAGLLFLLRFSLDDSVEAVMSAAVNALHALLVSSDDEDCLDSAFPWLLGTATFPLLPTSQGDEDDDDEGMDVSMKPTVKEKEDNKTDHDVARQDVVKGFLKMQGLPRLRYILEVVRPSPRVVLDILEILIRIARHSTAAAIQILDCPRLMDTVISEFLPGSWAPHTSQTASSLYGLPVALAMKLLHALASAGRHACARILNSLGGKEILARFVVVEPSEMLLEPSEALRCSTEALKMFAVAASYGQACSLYKDLYPVLVQRLQSGNRPCASSEAVTPLELDRVRTLLVLLTQVTHTAGCCEELQRGLGSSQGTECPPPPPVSWSHVTGLQPTVIGLLKGCVKALDSPGQMSSALILIPSYLLFMEAYYSQLCEQSSFQPVQCLQELESLTSDVLMPLISHHAIQNMTSSFRSSSMICNPALSAVGWDVVPSLPGLGCSKLKTTSNLTGPNSPLPLPTALLHLLNTITSIHKGITRRFSSFLLSDSVLNYLRSCIGVTPPVSLTSAWILRHEHHLLYLLLRLAHKLVPVDPEVAKHASLFHQVSLALLSWLLPGSEHLAHELMSTMIFSHSLLPEGGSGEPEVAALAELQLQEKTLPGAGVLLRNALLHLPSIRGCFLTHLAHMEPAVLASRDRYLGRTPWIRSHLLPELTGPSLPSDWPFLPLISLYERMGFSAGGGQQVESLPVGSLESVTHCLQWLLVLESWREQALSVVPPVAKLARLACVFLCSSDLFLERPVQELVWVLFRGLTRPDRLEALDLGSPPPGLASFHDLYSALLAQYEAVSFGDPLFGCFMLLPLQRRYSVSMRLAAFGEHVGMLRSLGVSMQKLPIPLEKFTSPMEDSLPLLRLYFRALVTGALKRNWCPVLYVVAVAHLNAFIFSQDAVAEEVEVTRRSLLRKTHYLTDEVLKNHLLFFRLPQQDAELGFSTYEQLPPIRAHRLGNIMGTEEKTGKR